MKLIHQSQFQAHAPDALSLLMESSRQYRKAAQANLVKHKSQEAVKQLKRSFHLLDKAIRVARDK